MQKDKPAQAADSSFGEELRACWDALPHKGLFAALALAWFAFYHFLGNSTLGYVRSGSLFGWMNYAYNNLEDDRHCKFIPVVVLVLFWLKRREILAVPTRHWWPALGLVAAGLAVHVLGFLVQQTRVSIVGFFLGLYGLMGAVWGPRFLAATFFPYFLLGFCVPIGTLADTLTFPLRMMVTHISVFLSHGVLGIDVVRDGTKILGAQGFNYDVAPACSGIRSLTILLAMTTIYGFTAFRAWWKRALMVFVALPLAVAGNVARITGVIVTAEAFGQGAGNTFHDWAGLITFVVALVAIFALGYWLKEDMVEPPRAAAA